MSSRPASGDAQIARSIEPLADEWDALADRLGARPSLRPGWLAAWWGAFGAGELTVLSVRRDGRLAGVLPMVRRRGALRAPANYHTPAFGPVAEDAAAAQELAREAIALGSRRLQLAMVDEDDRALVDYREAAIEAGYAVLARTQTRMPVVSLAGDWATKHAELSRKFRKELRRCRRRLEEQGNVSLEIAAGADALDGRLREVFAVENTGWKRARGTAMASRPETRSFYEDVARWAAARGLLRLLFLRLDGAPVAADYCLEDNGVRHMLKGGFDPRYASCTPGILLLEDGLAQASAAGLRRVELGGGDDPYKLRWTSTLSERRMLQAFAPSALGRADRAAFAIARPLAKRLLSAAGRGRRHRPATGAGRKAAGGASGR